MYISSISAIEATTTLFPPSTLTRAVALSAYETSVAIAGGKSGDGGSQLQRWSSLIGIVTAIVGNILISFALNIQRYAHIRLEQEWEERKERSRNSSRTLLKGYGTTPTSRNGNGKANSNGNGVDTHGNRNGDTSNDADEEDPLTRSFQSSDSTACPDEDHIERETYLHSGYWWAGIVLMTVGETGNFLAYGFAPASIVSPLGVVALISNCVIAPIMLKERFRWRDFWGVVVAVGGAVTVVLSAKQQEKKLGPHEVIDAITTMEFEIYMGITFSLIAVLMWASPRYGNNTILIDLGLVGLFGGYTALSTKGVASMLSSTLWKAFATPITFALIAVLVGTAIMQVRYVNKALQRFDSTQVIPVQFVMFTLSVIIGSAVLYRDFESTTPERAIKFVGGCLLTFFGVWLITSGRSSREEYDEEVYEEENEQIDLADQETADEDHLYHDEVGKNQRRTRGSIVDGTFDEPTSPDESRRSSRVSFLFDPSRPETPRAQSSQPPSIHLTPSVNTSRNSLESDGPLLSNPWKDSHDSLLAAARHPGMPSGSVVSSSVLPAGAMQPTSDDSLRRSHSHANPRTHPSQQHTNGPPTADAPRPVTPARNSLRSSMMPGPFISPLSSSLSAVVADTLRRGVESPLKKKGFRRPKILRRSQSGTHQSDGDVENDDGPALSKSVSAGPIQGRRDEEQKRSRARSLSNALGEFWRSGYKKQRRDEAGDGDRNESGPSGAA